MPDIKSIYEQQFLPAQNKEWFFTYRGDVVWAAGLDEAAFRSPQAQQGLWERDGITGIGPGNSVTVKGAYADAEIIDALWSLKNWEAPADSKEVAKHLDAEFERILALVSPRHSDRRPSARLARVFAMLRPYDVLCLMDWSRTAQLRSWLEKPTFGLHMIGQNVIARAALREALGPEKSLDDAIAYNQFAWFAWEMVPSDDAKAAGPQAAESDVIKGPTDVPRLVILPAVMQRKGMFYVTDNLRVILSIVRAAETGVEKEDLLQQIAEEAPALNAGSRAQVLSQAASMGLIIVEHGVYRVTPNGRRLLEGESPANVLTPFFVRSIFGFALILDDLRESSILTRGEIAKRAQGYYPKWTSEFAPNALVTWMRELDLISVAGAGRSAQIQLTENGQYWVTGLPANLKTPDHLLTDQMPEEPLIVSPAHIYDVEPPPFTPAKIDAVLSHFRESPETSRFIYSDEQVRVLHAALHSAEGKRFVLLAGLSGAGKTSIAKAYAQAYCAALGIAPNAHYTQVAVWPDWTDPSGLLGFVNPLASPPDYHRTEALRLLMAANTNQDKPYFLCLDEMNLARVEHYFAPFLSAMEGRRTELAIHAGDVEIDEVPPRMPWPENLFIFGTVNMDETTHPFSDKVLDRAFTFEFWDIDLAAWKEKAAKGDDAVAFDVIFNLLQSLYQALEPARRHFGYRTCDEVLRFCTAPAGLELLSALDAAVLTKILPKLRGDAGGALPEALQKALDICNATKLPRSAHKLQQMQKSLSALGIVRFWS
ncbi:hypothetical protein K9U39_14310 [Rhodoblastus acidophilus]|uniref:AAA+ ATPase domain-containing protein n=1 Tax=Candidatus Rhodoblastus alkanivorans TaxID=2954117 RepID=A0ABS9ZB28_9HYPH|nr:hypothetical protein [Candidatus Rhodoblastus alkanivorans]MCI4680029.1 hypothetical protein [Candidatus Rhodoblastus alkanivorans]MCI4684777.1 hypothetical protein [Candidatus Rhodoblastus alkanivorans]MDI4642100.1 hypothetical protein [Rhodoblastus acidophilus]